MTRWGPNVAPYVKRGPGIAEALAEAAETLGKEYEAQQAEKNELSARGATEIPGQRSVLDRILGRNKPIAAPPAAAIPQPEEYDADDRSHDVSRILPTGGVPDPLAPRAPGARSVGELIDQTYKPTEYTARGGKRYSVPNPDAAKARIGEVTRERNISDQIAAEERKHKQALELENARTANDLKIEGVRQQGQTARTTMTTQSAAARATASREAALQVAKIRASTAASTDVREKLRGIEVSRSIINAQLAANKVPVGPDAQMMDPEDLAELQSTRDDLVRQLAELEVEAANYRKGAEGGGGGGGPSPQAQAALEALRVEFPTIYETDKKKFADIARHRGIIK